ncbi:ATP-binding protein [Streptomyces sp. enrichment culture]|uniref:ATP-binding protein n=1 Tax=Streptomyces sp. enrichment culture TaxID=1795815 RepID=UPI003F551E3E
MEALSAQHVFCNEARGVDGTKEDCTGCVPRRVWRLSFLAEAEEVAALRRMLRLHLELWDLLELSDVAQLCVSELVANVINHVGPGTPTTLAVSLRSTRLRIEVEDPDPRALPVLACANPDAEVGRGMALVDAVADRWGIDLTVGHKVTWCEFRAGLALAHEHGAAHRVARATDVLGLYDGAVKVPQGIGLSRLGATVAEEAVIDVITDLLHWLRVHGRDPDDVLDRAQAHFEAESC